MWQEILGISAENVENCFFDLSVLVTPTEKNLGSIDSYEGPEEYFEKFYAVAVSKTASKAKNSLQPYQG